MNGPAGVLCSQLSRAMQTIGALYQLQNFNAIDGAEISLIKHALNLECVFLVAVATRNEHRTSHLPFFQTVRDGFSQDVLCGREAKRLIDQLERHAEAFSDLRQPLG